MWFVLVSIWGDRPVPPRSNLDSRLRVSYVLHERCLFYSVDLETVQPTRQHEIVSKVLSKPNKMTYLLHDVDIPFP